MAKTLADILGAVPNMDTGMEKIEYIDRTMIFGNTKNFYALDGIDELAANIVMIGLQQPIRVRPDDGISGAYVIVSGHRRMTAINKLSSDDPERWKTVPCIVERDNASPELQELRLIFANSDTRKMSSSDISQQVDRVRELLYKLQEQGYEFPGRMRDHVAEACNVSKSKIARLDAIKSGLEPSYYSSYYEGDHTLNESTAYELSKLPADLQVEICSEYLSRSQNGLRWLYAQTVEKIGDQVASLGKMKCDVQHRDCNVRAKTRHIVRTLVHDQYSRPFCSKGCCEECPNLQSCKDVCDLLKSKQTKMKADAKAESKRLAAEKDARERPDREQISSIYLRFSYLLDKAGVNIKDYLNELSIPYAGIDDDVVEKRCYSDGVQPTTYLPFSYSFSLDIVKRLCKAADILGCSIDYLLCRTDERCDSAADDDTGAAESQQWYDGANRPSDPCDVVADFLMPGGDKVVRKLARWDGRSFVFPTGGTIALDPIRWMEIPEVST